MPAAQTTVSSQDHEQKSMEEIANGIDESKVARRKEKLGKKRRDEARSKIKTKVILGDRMQSSLLKGWLNLRNKRNPLDLKNTRRQSHNREHGSKKFFRNESPKGKTLLLIQERPEQQSHST